MPLRRNCLPLVLALALALAGCSEPPPAAPAAQPALPPPAALPAPAPRDSMLDGTADLSILATGLAAHEPMALANTVLQLQLACARPEVRALLADLRADRRDAWPDIAWDLLATPALRIALAHTAAGCDPADRDAALPVLRAGLAESDPFAQAQAAVALAFVGDAADVPAIATLARDGAPYAAEAAIKALALQGGEAARAALLELREHYADDEGRSTIVRQVMAERWEEFRRTW